MSARTVQFVAFRLAAWLAVSGSTLAAAQPEPAVIPRQPVADFINSDFSAGRSGWSIAGEGGELVTQVAGAGGTCVVLQRGCSISRGVTVSRGRQQFAGRRYLVVVRLRIDGPDCTALLRVRTGTGYRDAYCRTAGSWQQLQVVIDSAAYLPGRETDELSLALSAGGIGQVTVDRVDLYRLPAYGIFVRCKVQGPATTRYQASFAILRHHRDKTHSDSERHRYGSTVDLTGDDGVAGGMFTAWVDLRRYLFGDTVATGTLTVQPTDVAPLSLTIELGYPAPDFAEQPVTETEPVLAVDDGLEALHLDEAEAAEAPQMVLLRRCEATTTNGLVSLLLPETAVPPDIFPGLARPLAAGIAARLAWVKALLPDAPRFPRQVPVGLNLSRLDQLVGPGELALEMQVLDWIGVSSVSRAEGATQVAFDEMRRRAGLSEPFRDRFYGRLGEDEIISPYAGARLGTAVTSKFSELAARLRAAQTAQHVAIIELMDEPPDYAVEAGDAAAFRAFLRSLDVVPAAVGCEDWESVLPFDLRLPAETAAPAVPVPAQPALRAAPETEALGETATPDDGAALPDDAVAPDATAWPLPQRRLLYYTRLFAAKRTSDLFRAATAAVETELPGVRTAVNFRAGIRRVLTAETADWFQFGRDRAVTMLWNEDWLNTYGWRQHGIQLVSYYTELMHAAGRKHDLPHGCFVIAIGFELHKAYSALAHGATHVNFWRYGPAYANYLPYSWSDSHAAVANVGTFCRDVAAIENQLAQATREPAQTALLYAKADPLWGRSQAENPLVYLALLHDQIPCEIITETEVELDQLLANYRCVYVTDVSVRRQTQTQLAKWVGQGGHLWLSGDAASRDEFNEPCELLAETAQAHPDRVRLNDGRPGERYEAPVRAQHNREVGKGRIQGGWQSSLREAITGFAKDIETARPAVVDVPCVETAVYRHAAADLVFLINYTGATELDEITVTVSEPRRVTSASSLRHGKLAFRQQAGRLQLSLPLAAADALVLECSAD